jgi:MFS transporter, UMF1 family
MSGALLFGRLANQLGAWRVVLSSLVLWTLVLGLVHQFTHSYRRAIVALIVFFVVGGIVVFVVGGLLLSRVRMSEGIVTAGNVVPAVI